MNRDDFYIYVLLDPLEKCIRKYGRYSFKNIPRYVGKGRGLRANASATNAGRNKEKGEWLLQLALLRLEPIVIIHRKNLTEEQAIKIERQMIKEIGRSAFTGGPLYNRGKGGEGRVRYDEDDVLEYKQFLASIGDLKLVGKFYNQGTYCEHQCPIHGIVRTAPNQVKQRYKLDMPLCPRCGEAARGAVQSKLKNELNSKAYENFFKDHIDRRKYKFIDVYTTGSTPSAHWCRSHGDFRVTPNEAKSKVLRGLTICGACNLSGSNVRGAKTYVKRNGIDYIKQLKDVGNTFKLVGVYDTNIVLATHECDTHGEVICKPIFTKDRIKRGLNPCPECNIDRRNSNNHLYTHLGGQKNL